MLDRLTVGDAPLHGKKVLVIDDDIRSGFALTSVLELHGLKVVYAEDGRGFPLVNPGVLPRRYTVIDLRSGAVIAEGTHHETAGNGRQVLGPFGDSPCAVIFTDEGSMTG